MLEQSHVNLRLETNRLFDPVNHNTDARKKRKEEKERRKAHNAVVVEVAGFRREK